MRFCRVEDLTPIVFQRNGFSPPNTRQANGWCGRSLPRRGRTRARQRWSARRRNDWPVPGCPRDGGGRLRNCREARQAIHGPLAWLVSIAIIQLLAEIGKGLLP